MIQGKETEDLKATVSAIAVSGKGILAADESTGTISKRFEALQIPCTEESRRRYRELLFTTPMLSQYIAGVILYEETLNQRSAFGVPFAELLKEQGIVTGIKVDKGLIPLIHSSEEHTTQGLDGLIERLKVYKNQGARFAKWRAVFSITHNLPTNLLIKTNAEDLARYAAICQTVGIVPIVEPEILLEGEYSLERSIEVSETVLHAVFHKLHKHQVILEYMILKPSMVTPGKSKLEFVTPQDIAGATIKVLCRTVPAAVPTINFLSGGQMPIQATKNLNAIHEDTKSLPWNVSFSFARALQEPCMKVWLGKDENKNAAQETFLESAKDNSLASLGKGRV
jgi:fructose-bisphosphate aldolase class I